MFRFIADIFHRVLRAIFPYEPLTVQYFCTTTSRWEMMTANVARLRSQTAAWVRNDLLRDPFYRAGDSVYSLHTSHYDKTYAQIGRLGHRELWLSEPPQSGEYTAADLLDHCADSWYAARSAGA